MKGSKDRMRCHQVAMRPAMHWTHPPIDTASVPGTPDVLLLQNNRLEFEHKRSDADMHS